MESLPSFPREDLQLCVFLGSGAFGEVYQGSAKDILGPRTGTQNVAVKVYFLMLEMLEIGCRIAQHNQYLPNFMSQ